MPHIHPNLYNLCVLYNLYMRFLICKYSAEIHCSCIARVRTHCLHKSARVHCSTMTDVWMNKKKWRGWDWLCRHWTRLSSSGFSISGQLRFFFFYFSFSLSIILSYYYWACGKDVTKLVWWGSVGYIANTVQIDRNVWSTSGMYFKWCECAVYMLSCIDAARCELNEKWGRAYTQTHRQRIESPKSFMNFRWGSYHYE